MKTNCRRLLLCVLLIFGLVGSCGNASYEAVDYAQSSRWLALPTTLDKAVDVFYFYPTAWQKENPGDPDVCVIDNASMLHGAASAFNRQATAFEPTANIFAPYYRQVDMSPPPEVREAIVAGIPTSDGIAAFDYYLEHYNNGRPYILAAHSQGSNVLANLLARYMKDHPEEYQRMIAAYVIGYTVTDDYLAQNANLRFAEGANDTGVIVSYNTEAPDTDPSTNPVVLPGALAINPITWTRNEVLAPASENLGSILLNPDGSVILDDSGNFVKFMDYADAKVDTARGVLFCSTADEDKLAPGNAYFGRGVYHTVSITHFITTTSARTPPTALPAS